MAQLHSPDNWRFAVAATKEGRRTRKADMTERPLPADDIARAPADPGTAADPACTIEGADRPGPWLVACDHATNRVPKSVNGGSLGIAQGDMSRHIAYDVGAAGVTRGLAAHLDGPAVLTTFSRLVIDPNRGEDDPTLLMRLYDGTIIPANRHADAAERERRLALFHRPYHATLERMAARRTDTILVCVHSFTPRLRHRPARPWHVGVLHAGDTRLAAPLIDRLRGDGRWCVGDNQPYSGALPGDVVDRHALRTGRANVLLEVRNDLIADAAGQAAWARALAAHLVAARRDAQL